MYAMYGGLRNVWPVWGYDAMYAS